MGGTPKGATPKPDANQCMAAGCDRVALYRTAASYKGKRGYCERHKALAATRGSDWGTPGLKRWFEKRGEDL
jgi:hypothetical protein